jgi:hypothetical protein
VQEIRRRTQAGDTAGAPNHACSTFYAVQATSAGFGLHDGKVKLNTEDE